jgi:diguanylate cyclase (GGDEF)-like protein
MSANDALTALRGAAPGPPLQVAATDWSFLFAAVQDRLRFIVGEPAGATGALPAQRPLARVKIEVLECAAALDTLGASLAHELGRCQRLEREFAEVQSALAQARAELVDTRDEERRARHLALHDSLTGLPNRRYFGEQLDRLLAPTAPPSPGLAILYIDLDGLKAINDVHGHDVGDELLKIVATRLRWGLRAQDMVGRLGGDEFACLVSDRLNREQLVHLACKLFDTVSAPVQIGRCRLIVRPSIGITTYPADGATTAALVKQADIAMYRAKRDQTGYAFFGDRPEGRLTTASALAAPPLLAAVAPAPPTPRPMTGSAAA